MVSTVSILEAKETGCLSLEGLSYNERRLCVLPRTNLSLSLLMKDGILSIPLCVEREGDYEHIRERPSVFLLRVISVIT